MIPAVLLRRSQPLQHISWYSGNPLVSVPYYNNYKPYPKAGNGLRRFRGLDERKINKPYYALVARTSHSWKREAVRRQNRCDIPVVHTLTPDEMITWSNDMDQWYKIWTPKEALLNIWTDNIKPLLFAVLWIGKPLTLLGIVVPIIIYDWYQPPEELMDEDEYFENEKWHTYGPNLAHHAYGQYAEARRRVRWDHADVNPVEYIPAEFRSKKQIEAYGPGKNIFKQPFVEGSEKKLKLLHH